MFKMFIDQRPGRIKCRFVILIICDRDVSQSNCASVIKIFQLQTTNTVLWWLTDLSIPGGEPRHLSSQVLQTLLVMCQGGGFGNIGNAV